MKQHPVFVPYGFRDAPEDVLRKLAYPLERGKLVPRQGPRHRAGHDGLIINVIMKTVSLAGELADRPARPGARAADRVPGCPRVTPRSRSDGAGVTDGLPAAMLPAIGDPGRAALELPDGPPPALIGPSDIEAERGVTAWHS